MLRIASQVGATLKGKNLLPEFPIRVAPMEKKQNSFC